METKLTKHLDGLQTILTSIHSLHSRLPASDTPAAGPGPFTAALLNTHNLPVVDYIRDADEVEARLFWYPPSSAVGSSSKAGAAAASGLGSGGLKRGDEDDATSLETRVPQERAFVPPTPLRGIDNARGSGKVALPQEVKVLLEAAKKLLDNGPHAPRARKHVKNLLQREREATRAALRDEALIKEGHRTLQSAAASKEGSSVAPALLGTSALSEVPAGEGGESTDLKAELERLDLEYQREEMEITALQVEKEDREDERRRLRAAPAQTKKAAAPSTATQRSTATSFTRGAASGSTAPTRGRLSGSGAGPRGSTASSRGRPSDASSSSPTAARLKTNPQTSRPSAQPKGSAAASSPAPLSSETRSDQITEPAPESETREEDVTVRAPETVTGPAEAAPEESPDPVATPAPSDDVPPTPVQVKVQSNATTTSQKAPKGPLQPVGQEGPFAPHPPATPELQALTRRVWGAFGAPLRFLAPEAGSAGLDFDATLDLLDRLACPSPRASSAGNAAGDESVSSASTGLSGLSGTSSTTAQGAGQTEDVQAPTEISTIGAYILWHLLRAPGNELNWKDFPVAAARWWITRGRPRFEEATGAKNKTSRGVGAPTSEEIEEVKKFVNKPVYELVGKNLLRVKRTTTPPMLVIK